MTVTCMVCDFQELFSDELNIPGEREVYNQWRTFTYNFEKSPPIYVATCPICSQCSYDVVFDAYKARIKSGRDFRYN